MGEAADAGYSDGNEGESPPAAHGTADDGFGDSEVDVYYYTPLVSRESSGVRYSVREGGPQVAVTCSPSASASVDEDADSWSCGVDYSVNIFPITIELYGGIGPTYTKHFLIGQGVGAYLSAPGAPSSPTDTYSWTISGGKPFDNYVAQNDHATYYPLGSITPLTNSTVHCYFAKPGTATLTCQANIAGISVTVDRNIALDKPSTSLSVQMGSVVDLGSGPTVSGIELAGISPDVGIEWTGSVLTPSDFISYSGNGRWNWTQLVASERKRLNSGVWEDIVLDTTAPPTHIYGVECLDNSYPYGSPDASPPDGGFWYDSDGTDSGSSDAPGQGFDGASVTEVDVLDSFHDYLMYLPPGSDSVVVPMKRVKWFWQGKGTQSGGVWTTSNKNSQWSFDGDFPDHPEWTTDLLNDFCDFAP